MRYRHLPPLGLLALLVLVVSCAPLAAIAPAPSAATSAAKASASNRNASSELTIIYTGYGPGSVDPASPCG